ncbi:MAG: leucine-rich repeat protein [Bacteroidaceae bacterium]|nr:leucine-rich repeat protein [Bacteroidaceae bacterium]
MKKLLLIIGLALAGMTNAFAESDYDYKVANAEGVEICYSVDNATSRTLVVVAGDAHYMGNVAVPNSVSIGGYSYSVVGIDEYAFYGCEELTSVFLSSTIQKIGMCAFSGCTGLTSIEIPSSVVKIGTAAFMRCTGLKSVAAKMASPVSISSNTFQNVDMSSCTLYVPLGAASAYKAADTWKNFTNIETFDGGNCGDNVNWSLVNGVLTIYGKGKMKDYNNNYEPWHDKTITAVNIEEGVTHIGDYAFSMICDEMCVYIPKTVTSIGKNAFSYNHHLEIHIPHVNSITIDENAFKRCTDSKFYYAASMADFVRIMKKMFSECDGSTIIFEGTGDIDSSVDLSWLVNNSGFTDVVINPSDWATVDLRIFDYCANLKSLTIPSTAKVKSLTYDENKSRYFAYCNNLTNLNIDLPELGYKGEGTILYYTKDNKSYSVFLVSPASQIVEIASTVNGKPVTGIRKYALMEGITCLFIPETVTTIEQFAFLYTNLKFIMCLSNNFESLGYEINCVTNAYIFAKQSVIPQLKEQWGKAANYFPIAAGESEDVNSDGKVNATDVMQIYNYILSH